MEVREMPKLTEEEVKRVFESIKSNCQNNFYCQTCSLRCDGVCIFWDERPDYWNIEHLIKAVIEVINNAEIH